MSRSGVCRVESWFVDEWCRAYPHTPVPVIQSVRDISLEGDTLSHGAANVAAVRSSLEAVDEKIRQLCEELKREDLVKEFLTRVLRVLEEEQENNNTGTNSKGKATVKDDDRGPNIGLVSSQTDNTCAEACTRGLTCDCVLDQSESCSLCALRGKVNSVKGVFEKLSPESLRFVSKVEVSRTSPRQQQEQSCRNSWTTSRNHDDCTLTSPKFDPVVSATFGRSNSVPDPDMFRKPKGNAAVHDDATGRTHKVGSKDNFMAVKAKHGAPGDVMKTLDSDRGSPKMDRHYQMLKLTPGYEFVLDNGGGEMKNWKTPLNEATSHGSLPINCGDNEQSSIGVKNSNKAVTQNNKTLMPRVNVSVINVESAKKSPPESRVNTLVNTDLNARNSGSISSDEAETYFTRQNSGVGESVQTRQNSKKAPVPPPVAKKPVKATNSNQLPEELNTPYSSSSWPTAKGFSEPTDATRDSGNSGGESAKPTLLLVQELKSKYVDRQNSWPHEEERARKEMTSQVLDNLSVQCDTMSSGGLSRPKSEEILSMKSYRPTAPAETGTKFTYGVDTLCDNMKTSFGLATTRFLDSDNLPGGKVNSTYPAPKRSTTPPLPPPRSQSLEHNSPESNSAHRLISSSSTDTVTEFNRNTSFASDIDIQEALGTLDTLLKTESLEDLTSCPVEQEVMEKPKNHKSRSLSYETWTINRAITTSITNTEFDSISDDDELDGSSPAAASPRLRKYGSPTGSKDSGLCDETTGDSVFDTDLSSGRIRDLRLLQAMEKQEEESIDQCDSLDDQALKFVDYHDHVAADTDFVFRNSLGSSDDHGRSPSPAPDYTAVDVVHSEEVDTGSWVTDSSGDEEIGTVMDTSHDELDSASEGILKMRQLLVKGVLDSEREYLEMLIILIHYKHSLEASCKTSMPVISKDDVAKIFSNIEDIYKIHNEFVISLTPKVQKWTHSETIGDIFKIMISEFSKCGSYLSNYHLAVSTVHKCCNESERFLQLAKEIKISQTLKQTTTMEDALFKPVQRVQRNTLVLHDLIKYTPEDHPDTVALKDALKNSQLILEKFASQMPKHSTTKENRRLVKSSFLVELVGGNRKLRFMFLFNDVLVCTKRVTHRNNKVTFDIKWFTPLNQMNFDTKFGYKDDLISTHEVDELKVKIRTLKKELRLEWKKWDNKEKNRSSGMIPRSLEKLKKKINQQEAQLILACPKLPFKVSLEGGKTYTMLMTTDYEREEWKETLSTLMTRAEHQQTNMNSIYVQELINNVKETTQVNKIGNVLMQSDEDVLTGTLNVTIHKLNGLTEDCDTYCCLEMDSFGHFFMKARTHIACSTRDPAWNEDFELELEGSQTLRFLSFRKILGDHGDKLLGRGALELSKSWLKGSFQEKTVVMNEISLVISVRHTAAEKTMSRTPSRTSNAVFGVKISSCARRENKTVPSIVTACLQEVEKRGLDEVGIYRVSGVTSDLQRIKKLFDKNIRAGINALEDVDIHAVTGTLKLYFRELPEPLFTEAAYHNFIDTLKLSDEEARAQCMLSLLHSLPDINYYTIVLLLEHLLKVARNVNTNKMSVHNLATVFGPTLLAPAFKQDTNDPMEMMFKGAEEVMHQSSVINYLLGLVVSGRSLRKSAQ